MLAIFVKELRAYFSSMLGYIVCAFLMLVTGIFFSYLCLYSSMAVFGYVISSVGFMLFIIVPILTMKTFADEEKLKTEQLLFSSAVSLWDIVIGKFLAAFAVFSLTVLEMCIFPLIIGKYGTPSYAMAYSTIFAYWLLGGLLIAIGMLISSLTDNSITAAVIGFMVMIVMYMFSSVADMFSTDSYVSLIAMIVMVAFVAIIISRLSADKKIPIVAAAVAVIVLVITYCINQDVFSGLIINVILNLSFFDDLSYFINGAFDGSIIFKYISVTILFLFLTVKSLQKRRWS